MLRRLPVVIVLAGVLAVAGAGRASAAGIRHFFFGPGVTTSCEMDIGVPKLPTSVYCQTYPHTESAPSERGGKAVDLPRPEVHR